MRITLIQVDKTDENWLREGISKYETRLKHYIGFETITVSLPGKFRTRSENEQKIEEEKLLLPQLEKIDYLILLDENGKQHSSVEFADFLGKRMNESRKHIGFLIGGPFGFSDNIKKKANYTLGLSNMTFSHQMVRLFFVEQIYRAFTIQRGEKYHHP